VAEPLKDELAWLNDPSLDEVSRWYAFKDWEAQQRRVFALSNEAREEFRAWLASEPSKHPEGIRSTARRHRKVFQLS